MTGQESTLGSHAPDDRLDSKPGVAAPMDEAGSAPASAPAATLPVATDEGPAAGATDEAPAAAATDPAAGATDDDLAAGDAARIDETIARVSDGDSVAPGDVAPIPPARGNRSTAGRSDRSGSAGQATSVDWATLVDGLTQAERPTFTAATSEDRDMELRLCHLHLRTGTFGLARIQLETLAGAGHLDRDGLLDLAEGRWRTGDLAGAAQAVDTYLEAGGAAPIGHVIAAEARSALGRPGEARRHARLAIEGLAVPLDALFAGQPRSSVWPHDPAAAPLTDTLFGSATAVPADHGGRIGVAAGGSRGPAPRRRSERSDAAAWVSQGSAGARGIRVAVVGGATGAGGRAGDRRATTSGGRLGPSVPPDEPALASARGADVAWTTTTGAPSSAEPSSGTGLWDEIPVPVVSADGHAELERARAALADGELHAATLRLAVVLRLSPSFAPVVLDLVGPWPGPEFDLVRGDALRLVGRESAAQQAFAAASAGIVDSPPGRESPAPAGAGRDLPLETDSGLHSGPVPQTRFDADSAPPS